MVDVVNVVGEVDRRPTCRGRVGNSIDLLLISMGVNIISITMHNFMNECNMNLMMENMSKRYIIE